MPRKNSKEKGRNGERPPVCRTLAPCAESLNRPSATAPGLPPLKVQDSSPPWASVTLIHHDPSVKQLIAKLGAREGWKLDAYPEMDRALGALLLRANQRRGARPTDTSHTGAGPLVVLFALRPLAACGLEWRRRLVAIEASVRPVLLAEPADAARGLSAIFSGACAFLLLPLVAAEVVAAVQAATERRRFISPAAQQASLNAICCPEPLASCTRLSPLEVKVLWATIL